MLADPLKPSLGEVELGEEGAIVLGEYLQRASPRSRVNSVVSGDKCTCCFVPVCLQAGETYVGSFITQPLVNP